MNNLEQFRQFLLSLLTEARELSKQARSKQVQMVLGSNVALLERIAMFISKSIKEGAIDMERAKEQIKVIEEGTYEGLATGTREKSPVTIAIISLSKTLRQGGYKQLDPGSIAPSRLISKVWNMSGKSIGNDIVPKKSLIIDGKVKEGLFLVRLTKEEMSARPKRARQVKS